MPLYQISPAQYQGFLTFFNKHSVNGFMGRNEIRAILATCNIKANTLELQEIIDSISVDASGITFQAFIDHCSAQHSLRNVDQEFAEAFRIYDRRGEGSLTREDVSYVMSKLGMKNVNLDKLMDEADTDKNNQIEYDEFVALMKRKGL